MHQLAGSCSPCKCLGHTGDECVLFVKVLCCQVQKVLSKKVDCPCRLAMSAERVVVMIAERVVVMSADVQKY